MDKKDIKTTGLILIALIIVAVGGFLYYQSNQAQLNPIRNVPPPDAPATSSPQNPSANLSVTYTNNNYGFAFSLPADWQGYSIVQNTWKGSSETNSPAPTGTTLLIRNPNWTAATHYEDIPILIFTIAQWNSYIAGNFSISPAPFDASELARNNTYVFALPPRWDYDYSQGYQEAENILTMNPLHPFDLTTTTPPSGVACTQEAKECPDGSYVGRTGPNCAFATCPGSAQ